MGAGVSVASIKECKPRVWMRKSDAKLGYAYADSWIGPIWFFAEHSDHEVLDKRFCNFVDDPRDPISLPRNAFVDLGPL